MTEIQALDDAQAIDLVRDLVLTSSLSGQERVLAAKLTERMAQHGFEARLDGAGNAVLCAGQGPQEVALVGHLDTVAGDLPVTIKGGLLHGRGAVDAKGALATFLVTASRLAAARVPLRLRVVGCVEEEAASSAGARHLARGPAPDLLVVGDPCGWEGIILGYKGYLRARLTISGEIAHTAHDTRTLPARACGLWASIESAARAWGGRDASDFEQLVPVLLDVNCTSDGSHAHVELDLTLRLPLGLTPDEAIVWLSERAATEGAALSVLPTPMPAWSGERDCDLVQALATAIEERGGEPRFPRLSATADLVLLAPAWDVPALAYGPGDSSLGHTPHEHLELAEYLTGIEVLVAALTQLAGKPAAVSAPARLVL